ncbi:MAG: TonB-dependent receptor plug domain-containing protein [Elusimicrobia bacterium]|nr:TonB-dependent receptor plug domain-containing protein [Elusimicrobiota bacterium]
MKTTMRAALAAAFLFTSPAARASGQDDLAFFAEEAKVITASRRVENVSEAPSAVEVVTAEEIRGSGAVNLWDFMRFRAGMNVVDGRSGEGNRALVSIRGFPAEFVDNLLVLVDGRSVYTGLSGGAVWEELPVQLQDIERIEIVRGPSAALYGSNAGLGVINVITRKPRAPLAVGGDARGGNQGFHQEQAAVEDGARAGAYRLSFAHKEQSGYPTTTGAVGQDYLFSHKGNFRGWWAPSERSTLELFGGGSWQNVGDVDPGNPSGRFRHDFQMLKHTLDFDAGSSLQTMLARRDDWRTYDRTAGGLLTVRETQYDAEASHRLDWLDDRLHTVYGGSLRHDSVDSAQLFAHPYQKNAVERGFVSQSWRVLPRLNLVGALSVEHSDTGGTEPAYQVAAVAAPASEHVLRLSYGLAPTIPTLYDKAARQQATATTLLVGNPGMVPQRLRSYEASYQGAGLDGRMRWEANLFYMTIDRLSETVVRSFTSAPTLLTLSFDNANNAIARGSELKWSWRWDAGRSVYANYTYETISDAKGVTNVRKGTPPHKLNLGGTAALGRGVTLTLNAGYQDAHTLHSQALNADVDVPEYWRLDGRLAFAPTRDVELFLACQNMAQERHIEFADGLAVPRTYQAGARVRWAR